MWDNRGRNIRLDVKTGWTDGLGVKSVDCSFRGPKFNSQKLMAANNCNSYMWDTDIYASKTSIT